MTPPTSASSSGESVMNDKQTAREGDSDDDSTSDTDVSITVDDLLAQTKESFLSVQDSFSDATFPDQSSMTCCASMAQSAGDSTPQNHQALSPQEFARRVLMAQQEHALRTQARKIHHIDPIPKLEDFIQKTTPQNCTFDQSNVARGFQRSKSERSVFTRDATAMNSHMCSTSCDCQSTVHESGLNQPCLPRWDQATTGPQRRNSFDARSFLPDDNLLSWELAMAKDQRRSSGISELSNSISLASHDSISDAFQESTGTLKQMELFASLKKAHGFREKTSIPTNHGKSEIKMQDCCDFRDGCNDEESYVRHARGHRIKQLNSAAARVGGGSKRREREGRPEMTRRGLSEYHLANPDQFLQANEDVKEVLEACTEAEDHVLSEKRSDSQKGNERRKLNRNKSEYISARGSQERRGTSNRRKATTKSKSASEISTRGGKSDDTSTDFDREIQHNPPVKAQSVRSQSHSSLPVQSRKSGVKLEIPEKRDPNYFSPVWKKPTLVLCPDDGCMQAGTKDDLSVPQDEDDDSSSDDCSHDAASFMIQFDATQEGNISQIRPDREGSSFVKIQSKSGCRMEAQIFKMPTQDPSVRGRQPTRMPTQDPSVRGRKLTRMPSRDPAIRGRQATEISAQDPLVYGRQPSNMTQPPNQPRGLHSSKSARLGFLFRRQKSVMRETRSGDEANDPLCTMVESCDHFDSLGRLRRRSSSVS